MKKSLMLGTHFDTMGGISSVVNVYRQAKLFERYPIHYIATHRDGGMLTKLRAALAAWLAFLGMLATCQVGIVHLHMSSHASFWRKLPFFALSNLLGIPTIVHLHSGAFDRFYSEACGPRHRWLIRHVFDSASRVIVLSTGWRDWLRTISSNPHIHAIYNPVLVPPAPAPAAASTAGRLLVLGRLGQAKGSYDLVDALAQLGDPAVRLSMGGDGDLRQVARTRKRGGAAQVELLGWVVGPAKEQALRDADVYLLPSYYEGLPMSVLEAMAHGLPVVTTPVGGIPEAVADGVEGFLVQPGDVAQLRGRIATLLADPALRQRMGAAARRKVLSTFSTDAVLPKIGRLYDELGGGLGQDAAGAPSRH